MNTPENVREAAASAADSLFGDVLPSRADQLSPVSARCPAPNRAGLGLQLRPWGWAGFSARNPAREKRDCCHTTLAKARSSVLKGSKHHLGWKAWH